MNRRKSPPKVPIGAGHREQRWRVAAVCLVLAAMTFAVFGQTLTHEFVDYDDETYVYDNPMVVQGLTLQGIARAFTSTRADNWHPLTWLSHMLDCQLYGLHPWGHHLTNVLLHTASVIALFLVLSQMTGAFWRSAFVGAVFAIHPLRVESVAWVAERKDVLSGLFFMLTLGAYVRYARRPWSWGRYGLVLLLFAMGLMCKPMLVTLPLVLLLLDYWPLQRMEPGKHSGLVLEKLPLLALSAASCVATLLVQNKAMEPTGAFSLPLRLGNALVSCLIYLGQMVWPAGLAAFYPHPLNRLPAWEAGLAGTLLAGLSVVAWRERRRRPWLLMGWVWYLVMLLPVAGIIQVGGQAHADRYTYLPQIGVYVAVTWLVAEWGATWQAGRMALGGLMTGVIAVLMVCAWKQTAYWKNNQTLWTHALACTTDNYAAHFKLGNVLMQKGRVDEAIPHYQNAVQIRPDYAQAHNNLGGALLQEGKVDEAIPHLQKALQINPGYGNAHSNLGNALLQKGSASEAIAHFQRALQIEPADARVLDKLALLLAAWPDATLRNGNKAVELARQANALTGGNNPFILHTLAAALAEAGRFPEAVETAQRALRLAGTQSNTKLAGALELELKLYQTGSPFHIPEPTH
jgi:Flp pilus assembly protein TadD